MLQPKIIIVLTILCTSPQLRSMESDASSQKTCTPETMLASEQLKTLWSLICNYKTPEQLDSEGMGFYDWINRMSPSYLAKAYSTKGDLLEGGRTKCIHKRGIVALATFTSIETDYKFTGLYAENSPILIRISLKEHSETIYEPGIALKFFIDNKPSENILAMSVGSKNPNPFTHSYTTTLPEPSSALSFTGLCLNREAAALETLGRGPGNPLVLSCEPLARISTEGKTIHNPKFPDKIEFRPTTEATNLLANEDIRGDICNKSREKTKTGEQKGMALFSVFANKIGQEPKEIGKIVLKSEFVTSDFADQYLYFRHSMQEYIYEPKEPEDTADCVCFGQN
jgi:hypothetical protein